MHRDEILALAKAESAKVVDYDLLGNPITDADVLLMSAYGPLVIRIANAAIQQYKDSVMKLAGEPVGYLRQTDKVLVFMPLVPVKDGDHFFTSDQLAASQLRETQLREALKSCFEKMRQMCLNGEWYDPDKAIDLAWNALAIPTDTNALDAYVKEKVKESTVKIADQLQQERLQAITDFGQYQEAHEQIATITRQRDLAVDAIETYLQDNDTEGFGCACTPDHKCGPCNAYSRQVPLAKALSAIKESEEN